MENNKIMKKQKEKYKLIEKEIELNDFYQENKNVDWIAFDTEFIGEKYFRHKLCLIAVTSKHGNYLIDTIKIENIKPFIKLIEDKKIIKVTHAGENDYRTLVNDYKAKPKNIFDTQLSSGFLGYGYPISLQKLIENELKIKVPKTLSASDWEKRPLSPAQLEYALNDVIHLGELEHNLKTKLEKLNRLEWVIQENKRFEQVSFYNVDFFDKVLNNNFAFSLPPKEKIFLLRLYQWREKEAERRNIPEKRILSPDTVKAIVQIIASGQQTLENDRRIPNPAIHKHWQVFSELFKKEMTEVELNHLSGLTDKPSENSSRDILIDMLHLIIKFKAVEQKIAPELLISRKDISRMKTDKDFFPAYLNKGWRRDLLGSDIVRWLKRRDGLKILHEKNKVILSMKGLK
jgi:ribonuclease D